MSDGLSFFQRIVINYLKLDPQKIGKIGQNLTGGGIWAPQVLSPQSVLFSDFKVFLILLVQGTGIRSKFYEFERVFLDL